MLRAILFDLDGTLVDSAAGILDSLKIACENVGVTPVCNFERSLIGPPLEDIINTILDKTSYCKEQVVTQFKEYYDENCHKISPPFAGVEYLLQSAFGKHLLFIVTNKRLLPTLRILRAHDLDKYFNGIFTPDFCGKQFSSKSALIQYVLNINNLEAKHCIYVGDTMSDYRASQEVGMPCHIVAWSEDKTLFDFDTTSLQELQQVVCKQCKNGEKNI